MWPAKIPRVEVRNHILNPAEAELWMTVHSVDLPSDTELRGRLVGPRCHYATTVEVAYPLRSLPGRVPRPGDLTARVIIPEPSFWDPESPFLYQGSIEVWKGDQCWYEMGMSYGLRMLQLGKRDLRCNGRALMIRGVSRQHLSAEDALQLRRGGYNTLLSTVSAETADVWDAADRCGFLVLGRLPDTHAAFRQVEALKFHACCLGWLLPKEALEHGALLDSDLACLQSGSGQLLGAELDRQPSDGLLQRIQFIFANEHLLPLRSEVHRPILLKSPQRSGAGLGLEQAPASSAILGWIAE